MILERNTVPKNVLSFSSSSLYSKYSLLTTACVPNTKKMASSADIELTTLTSPNSALVRKYVNTGKSKKLIND
jgi:hypothetical protein